MVGVYIFGGLVLAGVAVLVILKIKWSRESSKEASAWRSTIASDRAKDIRDQEDRKR